MNALLGKIEQVAALTASSSSNICTQYNPLLEKLLSDEIDQPKEASCELEAGTATSEHEPVPWLYLADGRNPEDSDMMLFPFYHRALLNVDCDTAGIGSWLRWYWPSAEVAFFEGMYRRHLCIVPRR